MSEELCNKPIGSRTPKTVVVSHKIEKSQVVRFFLICKISLVSSKGYGWKYFELVVMQLDKLLIEAGLDINDCYTKEE